MIDSLIERFASGGEILRQGLIGLTKQDLNARPIPETWTIQEIVIHMQDSDLIGCDRMKRIIAEPNPMLLGYNETLFTKCLFPELQDTQRAVDLFDMNRQQMTVIFRQLPKDAFLRTGVHSEKGLTTLEHMLESYVDHLDHHMVFLRDKRARLGKALKA